MESLYLRIAERLRSVVPELDHIDEDTGQLYPVQYDDRYSYPYCSPAASSTRPRPTSRRRSSRASRGGR